MKFFSELFASRARREAAMHKQLSDLRREHSILCVANLELLESVEDLRAEADRHGEAAAAARLRNTDLQRRLDATLQALDKERAEAERLQAEVDRKSSMTGDHRYWEGRYRDEAAEVDKLRSELSRLKDADDQRQLAEAVQDELSADLPFNTKRQS